MYRHNEVEVFMLSDSFDVTAASRTFLASGSKADAWAIRSIQANNDQNELTYIVGAALLRERNISLVVRELSNVVMY